MSVRHLVERALLCLRLGAVEEATAALRIALTPESFVPHWDA